MLTMPEILLGSIGIMAMAGVMIKAEYWDRKYGPVKAMFIITTAMLIALTILTIFVAMA